MVRPQNPHTPTEVRECAVHGLMTFRRHKVGIDPRTQKQKYRWRCPRCHAERNR